MHPPLLEVKLSFYNEKTIRDWAIAELKKEGETDFSDLQLTAVLSDNQIKAQIKLRNWTIIIGTDIDYDHIFYYNESPHRKAGPAYVHYWKNLYFIDGKRAQFPSPFEHIKPFIESPHHSWVYQNHSKDFYINEHYFSIEYLPNGTLITFYIDTNIALNIDCCKAIINFLIQNHNISMIEALLHPSEKLRLVAEAALQD